MRRIIKVFVSIIVLIFTACTNSQQPTNNVTTNNAATPVSMGQQLFETRCATCHGVSGTAGIGNAANLHTCSLDSNTIVQVVSNGRNGMPSFKNSCSEEEIHKIAAYVYTLRK